MTGHLSIRGRAVLAMLAALVTALVLAATAQGQSAPGVRVALGAGGFTAHPTAALLSRAGLAPGDAATGTLGVRNDMDEAGELRLRLSDVRDDGGLAARLHVTLAVAPSRHAAYTTRWTGSAAALERGADLGTSLPVHGTRWVRMVVSVDAASGNEIASDSFRFGLVVQLQGATGSASLGIGAASAHRGPAGASSNSWLSVTGVPLALLVAGGLLLVLAGGMALRLARVRAARAPRAGT